MSSDDFYRYPPPNDDGYTTDGGESTAGSIFSETSSMDVSWHFRGGRGRPRGRPPHSGRERRGGGGRGRGEIVGGRGCGRQSDGGNARMESEDVRSMQSTPSSTGGLGGSGPFPGHPGGSTARGSGYRGAPRGRRPGGAPSIGRGGYAPRGVFRGRAPAEETFERKMFLREDGVDEILREITLDNVTVVTITARRDVKSCRMVIVKHKASVLSKMEEIEGAYGVMDSEDSEIFTEYEENEQKRKKKVQNYMEGKKVKVMTPEVQHDLIEDTDVRTGAYLMYDHEDHELLLVCFRNLARAINRSDFKVSEMVRVDLSIYPQRGSCRVKMSSECTDHKHVLCEIGNALDAVSFDRIKIFYKFDALRLADIRKQCSGNDARPTRKVIGRVTSSRGHISDGVHDLCSQINEVLKM